MAKPRDSLTNNQSGPGNLQEEMDIHEDEIDLRKYFEVISRRKKLILSVFFISGIAAAIVSLCLPKIYKATSSIMVMPSKIQSVLSPTRISLDLGKGKTKEGEYIEQRPTISIPTHKALLRSSSVLERLMAKLKSGGILEEELVLEELAEQLGVENTENTNVLHLAVEDKKPGRAKEIATIWANEYVQYSSELIRGEVKGSGDFVFQQFKLAQDDLVKAEQAIEEFDVKERLPLLEIELKENQKQLESHYAKVYNLEFGLQEKKKLLQKTDEDIAAMTKDGIWLGSFSVKALGQEHFADEGLSSDQKALQQKVLRVKLALEEAKKKRDSFVNESKINLLKEELTRKRNDLVSDKSLLAQVKQLGEATKVNLKSKSNLEMLKHLERPIAENLSDLMIWEILSLTEGYNFFETKQQSLTSKLKQQETELMALEKVLFEYEDELKTLDENLNMSQLNYDFYVDKLKKLESQKNTVESEIRTLEFELSYSRELAKKLENQVKALKVAINEKKEKQTELNRQLTICKNAYENLSTKIEEARIAKALELGEVKVVSQAFEPTYPIKPRKKLIVATAGVSGLMLGVFIAFFLEFWRKSERKKD